MKKKYVHNACSWIMHVSVGAGLEQVDFLRLNRPKKAEHKKKT